MKTPPCDASKMVEEWLATMGARGREHSQGRFTLDADQAQKHWGQSRLELCDVPLLLMAGAVEGGSRFFQVHGHGNVRLCWEGALGPSGEMALSLLRHAEVDASVSANGVELPPYFEDLLDPLASRCRNAPLHFICNSTVLGCAEKGDRVRLTPSSESRLVLVDRGVDFAFHGGFAGLDVTAWVAPLPGSPWPSTLLAGRVLREQLQRVASAIEAARQ